MKNIVKAAAVLSTLSMNAEAVEAYNKAKIETGANLAALRMEIPTENTKDKVVTATDFSLPSEITAPISQGKSQFTLSESKGENNETQDPTPTEKAKKVIYDIKKIKDLENALTYIDDHSKDWDLETTSEIIRLLNSHIQKNLGISLEARGREISNHNGNGPEKYKIQAIYDRESISIKKQMQHYEKIRDAVIKVKKALNTNEFTAKMESEMQEVRTMDKVFAEILADPKYAGDVLPDNKPKLAKELADKFFAEFGPEFKKGFQKMNLKLYVEKYGTDIEVYIVYGIDNENEEEAEVVFLNNDEDKGTNNLAIINDEKYGIILVSKYGKSTNYQEIREKSGEISKIVIDTDGIPRDEVKVKKSPNSIAYK